MSHPIYSSQQLLNRGLAKVKKIAADLGVIPTGDKRLIQSWVDAIVEHQAAQVSKIEIVEATIEFDNGCGGLVEPYTALIDGQETLLNGWSHEGLTEPYMVMVNGEVVHRAATYQQAERYCKWHSLTLVDSQTLAQNELEVEMEQQAATRAEKAASVEVLEQVEDEGFVKFVVQSGENLYTVTPAHPVNKERCERGDVHFRSVECKHQNAVKNALIAKIQFISPADFGDWEAIVDNEVIGTIDQDFEAGLWRVNMLRETHSFSSYLEAEQFIKDQYVGDVFMNGRGSGRIEQPIEDIGYLIEDINFRDERGQQYSVRFHGVLTGYIWLNDDLGWTLNGEDHQDDWRPVAKELVKLTRHEYLVAA